MTPCLLLCFTALIPPLPPRNATLPSRAALDCRFPPRALLPLTHRHEPLVAGDAQDRVVRAGPARRRVDEQVDVLVDLRRRRGLRKHDVQVRRPKHRLSRVERQPGQLRLD